MDTGRLETTDIFRGEFFLCKGSVLSEVRFRDNGKRIASFLFTGADLEKLDKDYMNGNALVNPVQLRESLNRLRDILFEQLQNDGETRYDRKRQNRVRQARR